METSKGSQTALFAAFARAYHARGSAPKIFDDFLAKELLTPEELAGFERHLGSAEAVRFFVPELEASKPDAKTVLAAVMQIQIGPITLSRSRYAEDSLESALKRGVGQYVILGAGLDTFAFRRPELLERLRVFELDHPATQADKLQRIARAKWIKPERLHFVPVDFAPGDLSAALKSSPFDPAVPTFFSWLGVTYYLAREAIFETLRSLATVAARGSSVVFDHLDADAFDPNKPEVRRVRLMKIAAERSNEPMKAGLEPSSLSKSLSEVGLTLNEQLAPEQIQSRYFAGRNDEYRAFENIHFVSASVDLVR
jgi:methyltransferase (TIGR00027 family)